MTAPTDTRELERKTPISDLFHLQPGTFIAHEDYKALLSSHIGLERSLAAQREQIAALEAERKKILSARGEGTSICTCHNYPHLPNCGMDARIIAAEQRAESAERELVERERDAEAMRAATYSHIDGRDLLHELQPNGAHHIDIVVRINGEERRYEGDWLKTLTWARDGHNLGEYADNPKLRAMIESTRADEIERNGK